MKLFLCILCIAITIIVLPISSSHCSTSKPVILSYDDLLNQPTKNIDPNKPMVALTFDDGPTRKYTTMILDTLKQYHCYATFFVLGDRVSYAPDLLERMILEGHEIGNHTYSHIQLTTLDSSNIKEEIERTQEEIYNVIHCYPSVIRPPYGDYNESVLNHLGELRIVTWNVDSEDWKSKNPKKIVEKVLEDVKDKDIILLHDLYLSTAQAVQILIPALLEEGYQIVSVSDLYSFE